MLISQPRQKNTVISRLKSNRDQLVHMEPATLFVKRPSITSTGGYYIPSDRLVAFR